MTRSQDNPYQSSQCEPAERARHWRATRHALASVVGLIASSFAFAAVWEPWPWFPYQGIAVVVATAVGLVTSLVVLIEHFRRRNFGRGGVVATIALAVVATPLYIIVMSLSS